jgi:hypothetical protein
MERSAFWQDLANQFDRLRDRRLPLLKAWCRLEERADSPTGIFGAGEWWIAGDLDGKLQFEEFARQSMVALGGSDTAEAWIGWLDHLRTDVVVVGETARITQVRSSRRERAGDLKSELVSTVGDVLELPDVCAASRDYCKRMLARVVAPSPTSAPADDTTTTTTAQSQAPVPAQVAEDAPPTAAGSEPRSTFRRNGAMWEIAFWNEALRILPDRAGMEMIQRLLAAPGQWLSAEELLGRVRVDTMRVGDLTRQAKPAKATETDVATRESGALADNGSDVFDRTAWMRCQAAQARLEGELADAQREGDSERAMIKQEELEALEKQMSAGTFAGRSRQIGSPAITNADSARKAYQRALDYLRESGALDLHAHIDSSITSRKGQYCYTPVPPIDWQT